MASNDSSSPDNSADQALATTSPPETAPRTTPSSNMLNQAHHYVSIKLTASNFLFWRAQLVPFLRGQNLYGFVDGTTACPPEFMAASSSDAPPAINPAHALWIQQDQSILSMLFSSLAEEVLYLAIGHSTSRSLWTAVETALGSSSRARSLSLLTQLQNLRQGDSSPSDYLGRARVLIEQLMQAGRPVSLDEQNLHVFRGLRPEYRGLVASLTANSNPLTLPEVADLLATHQYLFLEDAHSAAAAPPAAFFSQQPPVARGRGRSHRGQRGRGQCGRGSIRCQICDIPGHTALTCYRRYSDGTGGNPPPPAVRPHAPHANVALHQDDLHSAPFTNVWLPDTGANAHATPNQDIINDTEPYTGTEHLKVGDGTGSGHPSNAP
ncbi:PREDICTED: uncharacterized protein LOC109153500 [Ipomoea nil]|uniref:uncharacterized protein LOC109153500 n=1 Tax=Ipomoea nil TaxID=35883 RepID=UPI000900E4FB|nr:PREDICTED: uncharacterized protein LOC109153500 [Ipomoea nil]